MPAEEIKTLNETTLIKIFVNDIKTEINFLLDEFLHIAYLVDFFSKEKYRSKSDDKGRINNMSSILGKHSLRDFFQGIKPILREIRDDLEKMVMHHDNIQQIINKDKENGSIEHYVKLFKNIDKYTRTKKRLLEKFVFVQRKIISILDSFPFYYPSPKVSSIKEASKIHLFIELIAEDTYRKLCKYIGVSNVADQQNFKMAYFYWDYDPELRFLSGSKLFIFNSNFFLPEKQSYWVILLHEIFHFILSKIKLGELEKRKDNKSNSRDKEGNDKDGYENYKNNYVLIEDLLRYIDRCGETIYTATRSPFGKEEITDIFIDSILAYILGKSFFIPAFSNLFMYDEDRFLLPESIRVWYVRLKVISSIIEEIDPEVYKECESILKTYKMAQKSTMLVKRNFYTVHEKIAAIVEGFCKSFIKRYKTRLEELGDMFKEENSWLGIYLSVQDYFIKRKWKSPDEMMEGRKYCYNMHMKLLKFEPSNNAQMDYDQLKVVNFKYIKTRYDKGPYLNVYKDKFHALSYGVYTGLTVTENYKEKESRRDTQRALRVINRLIDESSDSNRCINTHEFLNVNIEDIEYTLVNEGVPFYKKDYNLTYIFGNNLENIIRNPGNKVYIIVKYLVNIDGLEDNSCRKISKLFWKFKKCVSEKYNIPIRSIRLGHFISFDWFDLATVIAIDLQNKKENIDLHGVLQELKCKVLINNSEKVNGKDVPVLSRTETDMFIGREALSKVIVPKGPIHLRVSSDKLGQTSSIVDDIKKTVGSDWIISLRFGIRDLILYPKEEGNHSFKDKLNMVAKLIEKVQVFSDFQFVVSVSAECE